MDALPYGRATSPSPWSMTADKTQAQSKLISEAISDVLHEGSSAVLATLIELPRISGTGVSPVNHAQDAHATLRVGAKLLVKESGDLVGSLGDSELDEAVTRQTRAFLPSREEAKSSRIEEFALELERFRGASVLFERVEAEPQLVVCGAGHVGASLARLAALVGYQVTLIDDRAEFVNRELFASQNEQSIELVLATNWSDAVRDKIGKRRGVSIAIVTRGHKQDEDCLRAAISSNPDYVGMIGSKRRTNIVLEKLREEGADEERLKKVRAPIGLDIAAVSPEEVALAILAEIVAERRGGSGGSLSEWRRNKPPRHEDTNRS
jgi:xanthine/CO dehydrogenase XdhC/CoxF family maturation factor